MHTAVQLLLIGAIDKYQGLKNWD